MMALHQFVICPYAFSYISSHLQNQSPIIFIYHCSLLFVLNFALNQVRLVLGFGQKEWSSCSCGQTILKNEKYQIQQNHRQKSIIKTRRYFFEDLARDFFIFCTLLFCLCSSSITYTTSQKTHKNASPYLFPTQINIYSHIFLLGFYLRILTSHLFWDKESLSNKIINQILVPFQFGLFLVIGKNWIVSD